MTDEDISIFKDWIEVSWKKYSELQRLQ
jgi:hypothetical protein